MKKILIVEDEDMLRDAYEMILSTDPSYAVDVATNGKEALDKCQQTQYDLILLDIMMPIMSGIEFLKMSNELDIGNPKIILMSNLSSGKEIDDGLNLGAVKNYLKSSLSPKELISTVKKEIKSKGIPSY